MDITSTKHLAISRSSIDYAGDMLIPSTYSMFLAGAIEKEFGVYTEKATVECMIYDESPRKLRKVISHHGQVLIVRRHLAFDHAKSNEDERYFSVVLGDKILEDMLEDFKGKDIHLKFTMEVVEYEHR